ncbi:uncharacterized protein [Euwallacea similis]|uniref:uncharacterized protein n=1 Tax=Euwallacea similis TaxID=1736056 RepID=UPI00344ED358
MEYTSIRNMAVMMVIVDLLLTGASPLQSLQPCSSNLEDQHLPDSSDCSRYFRCVYGRSVPKQCPEKMLFNPSIGNCDLYYNVECLSAAQSDDVDEQDLTEAIENLKFVRNPKVPAPILSDISDGSLEKSTDFETKSVETSTLKFVYLPHDKYPNAYFKVENGEKVLLFCNDGMVFSFDMEICAKFWDLTPE